MALLEKSIGFIGQNSWLGKARVGCWHSACRWPDLSLPPALPSACSLWAWDWFIFGSVPSSHWLRVKGQESHRSPDLLGCSGPLCSASSPYRVILFIPTTTNQMALFRKSFLKNFELVWFWISNSSLLYCIFLTIIKRITYWKLIVLNMKRCSLIIRRRQWHPTPVLLPGN